MAANSDFPDSDTGASAPAPGYLPRSPAPVPAIVAITIAVAILAVGILELHRSGQGRMAVALGNPSDNLQQQVPVLQSGSEGWHLNGQPIADTDIAFRLSAMAAGQPGIIVKYTPADSSDKLAQALNLVNQAGFSQVSLQSDDAVTTR